MRTIYRVSQKSRPPTTFNYIFASSQSFCIKFYTLIGHLYPRMCTNFRLSILTFNEMALIFLPCDAMRCTVFVREFVRPSVCPSVCLSDTLVDCVHMVRPTIMISSPYGSPIILVSGDIALIPKFEGGHPERGR